LLTNQIYLAAEIDSRAGRQGTNTLTVANGIHANTKKTLKFIQ